MVDDTMTAAEYRKLMGLNIAGTPSPPRNRPEEDLQIACVDYLRTRKLEERGRCFMFHVPNEKGSLSRYEMVVRQRIGVKAGVADLILMLPDGKGLAFELKSGKNKQTTAQHAFQVLCLSLNWPYRIVRSLEEFEEALSDNGILEANERLF